MSIPIDGFFGMKSVLIISAVYLPEPVVSAKLSADVYQSLKGAGYRVFVLHPAPTRPYGFSSNVSEKERLGEDEVMTKSYTCPQFSLFGRIYESWSFGKACSKYLKEHSSEISCIYANAWPMFSQRAIVKTAKKYNIPCVIHVQDIYPESLTIKLPGMIGRLVNILLLPMDKYIMRNCSKVVAISEKMKTYLSQTRGISLCKISVVINWQDEHDFLEYQQCRELKGMHEPFIFMYMGNIGPVAGVDLLIEAFVRADLKNAKLVVAGSGSMREKMKVLSAPHKNIEFWQVPNGKVPEIQAKADCMLLPIKKGAASSSIPSKLPAYMFSAKPIIGCVDANSDTANAINDAGCGWVIAPENAELLAEMMQIVVKKDMSCLKQYGDNAFAYGIEYFSKAKNLERLINVIEDLC